MARIVDGETVQLDDGSEVRLIGALAPRAADAGADRNAWPAELQTIRSLTELVLGRTVKLAYGGRRTDRYGRHLAHLFLKNSGSETWVQGELLLLGSARAYGLPGSFICGQELLAHEAVARSARRGLWAIGIYRPKPAHLQALLMSRRGRFEIVDGIVASVSRTKTGVYLNFGTDWKSDFTIRISKNVLTANAHLDQALAAVTGKTVSVRGWIDRRNGPMIDVQDPSQLDLRLSPDAGAALSSRAAPNSAEPANAPSASPLPTNPPNGGSDGDAASQDLPDSETLQRRDESGANAKRPGVPRGRRPGAVDL